MSDDAEAVAFCKAVRDMAKNVVCVGKERDRLIFHATVALF
jgi:hypothetical protein